MLLEDLIPDLGHNRGPELVDDEAPKLNDRMRMAMIVRAIDDASIDNVYDLVEHIIYWAKSNDLGELVMGIKEMAARLRLKRPSRAREARDNLKTHGFTMEQEYHNRTPVIKHGYDRDFLSTQVSIYLSGLKRPIRKDLSGRERPIAEGPIGTQRPITIGTERPIEGFDGTESTHHDGARKSHQRLSGRQRPIAPPLTSSARQVAEIAEKSGAKSSKIPRARVEDIYNNNTNTSLHLPSKEKKDSPPPPKSEFSGEGSYAIQDGRLVCSDAEWSMWVRQGLAEGERERILIEVLGKLYDADLKGGPAKLHRKAAMLISNIIRQRKESDFRYKQAAAAKDPLKAKKAEQEARIKEVAEIQRQIRAKAARGEA